MFPPPDHRPRTGRRRRNRGRSEHPARRKAPTLRNIACTTAPYMHNGALSTGKRSWTSTPTGRRSWSELMRCRTWIGDAPGTSFLSDMGGSLCSPSYAKGWDGFIDASGGAAAVPSGLQWEAVRGKMRQLSSCSQWDSSARGPARPFRWLGSLSAAIGKRATYYTPRTVLGRFFRPASASRITASILTPEVRSWRSSWGGAAQKTGMSSIMPLTGGPRRLRAHR